MHTNTMKFLFIPVLLAGGLMLSSASQAFRGVGAGGDFRDGAGGFHQNDNFDYTNTNVNVNRNNDYVGAYRNNYWGATVAVPVGGYYSSQCQTMQVCDSSGQCALQNSCD